MQNKSNPENKKSEQGKHEHKLPQEISQGEKEQFLSAHQEAEKDMENDAEFTATSPNDDLDEGESARLGEETDLI